MKTSVQQHDFLTLFPCDRLVGVAHGVHGCGVGKERPGKVSAVLTRVQRVF
jgi:hypothetical protein